MYVEREREHKSNAEHKAECGVRGRGAPGSVQLRDPETERDSDRETERQKSRAETSPGLD